MMKNRSRLHPRNPEHDRKITRSGAQPPQQPGNTKPGHAGESHRACDRGRGVSTSTSGFEIVSVRTTSRTVTFCRPFILSGISGIQPAGCYTVETDEELARGLSSSARGQIATMILLPAQFGGTALGRVARIDPLELEVALERDALNGMA
jgi:hypothetical protein